MSSSTFSLILLVTFIAVILITLLAGVIGFVKGIYKTTVKTLIKTILVIVMLFTSPTISNWVGNIDISRFFKDSTEQITILSYLVNYLNNTGLISPMNGMSVYETVIALANSLLSFAIFFVGLILIQIFISLITAIVYHGIFRWFVPVETKKERKFRKKNKKLAKLTSGLADENREVIKGNNNKKKLPLCRIPGGILGAIQEFIFVLVLLCPITGLARMAINNKDSLNDSMKAAGVSEENVQKVDDYLAVTENSLLYKMLGYNNFDLLVMNQASKVTLNDTEIILSNLVDSVFDIADPLIQDGTISYERASGQVTINLSTLLSTEVIDSLVGKIISSPMVMALIPPVVDTAMNSVKGVSFAIDRLDFTNIDWSSELTILNGIYDEVYFDVIKPMIVDGKISPSNFKIDVSELSDEQVETYCDALSNLGKLESVSKNMGVILSGLGTYFENMGMIILPTDHNAYSGIDWSEDLYIIGKSLFKYFKTVDMDISSQISVNQIQEKTLEALKDSDKRKLVEEIVCGSDNNKGLLDTTLFSVMSLSETLYSTIYSVNAISKYVKNLDFSFLNEYTTEQLKKEFSTMFDIAGIVFDENSKIKIDNLSTIDLSDTETAEEMAELLNRSKKSNIFKKLYPSVMKGIIFQSDIDFDTYLFGLTPYNFNYNSETFIDDFREILLLLPDLKKMQNSLNDSSLSDADKIKQLDTLVLRKILNLIINSDFFNSDQITGVTSRTQKNVNVYTFLSNLFNQETFKNIGFISPSLEDLQDVDWGHGVGNDGGEIDLLCSLIENGQINAEFITSMDLKKINDTSALANMIKDGLESKVVSPSILSIIDNSLTKYLEKIGIPYTFNQMRNSMWIEDADYLGSLIDLIKDKDLDNIDFNSFTPEELNSILTILYKMNLSKASTSNKNDPFGYTIYSIMKSLKLFDQLGITIDESLFNMNGLGSSWSSSTSYITINDKQYLYTDEGEIFLLANFYSVVKEYGIDKLSSGVLPDGFIDALKPYLSSKILKYSLPKIINKSKANIQLPEGYEDVVASLDLNLLSTMDDDTLYNELKTFEKLYQFSNAKIDGKSKTDLIFSDFYNLGSIQAYPDVTDPEDPNYHKTLEEDLDDMINMMSTSVLFTTKKEGYDLPPISYVLKGAMQSLNMMTKVTLESNTSYQQSVLYGILNGISDWKEESKHFTSILNKMQGLTAEDLNLIGDRLTKEQALALMTEMNESELFHRVPISMFKSGFEGKGFEEYLKDPDTGVIKHPLNFYVHLTTSKEDISYWKNEIDNAVEMILGDGGLRKIFADKDKTIADYYFDEIGLDFLYYIGNMHLFEKNRSYLLYHMIDQYSTTTLKANSLFKDSVNAPYGENASVYRFEELFFSNPKLLDQNGKLDETKSKTDLAQLNSLVHSALKLAPQVSSGESLKDIEADFLSMTENCYRIENGVFYRNDFASELMAGLETKMVNNEKYATYFENMKDMDFYADDYQLINSIEARALNGILALTKTEANSMTISSVTIKYYSKSQLENIFPLLGEEDATKVELDSYQYFITYNEYKNTHNSIIALKANDNLLKLPVVNNTTSTLSKLSDCVTLSAETSSYSSILASADIM